MSYDFSHRWHDRKDRSGQHVWYSFFTDENTHEVLGDAMRLGAHQWRAETFNHQSKVCGSLKEAQQFVERATIAASLIEDAQISAGRGIVVATL